MKKVYKAKKGSFIKRLFLLFIVLPVIIYILDQAKFDARPYLMLPFLTPLVLILWSYFDTFYRIDDDKKLYYRFSFVRGSIVINDILEIKDNAVLRKGKKPALSNEGFVLIYDKNKKIFLAPEDKTELIEELLRLNPKIRKS